MKSFLKIFALAFVVSVFPACESNLELEPYTALDASTGFKTKPDIEAAMLVVRPRISEVERAHGEWSCVFR